jgi:hypothetical protein
MTEPSVVHSNEIISSLRKDLSEEGISGAVVSIAIIEVYNALSVLLNTRVSVIGNLQLFALTLDFQVDRIGLWERDIFIVDVFFLELSLILSEFLADK